MQSNPIQVRPVGAAVGAELTGVALAEPLADYALQAIRRSLADKGIVFFRDQQMTPE